MSAPLLINSCEIDPVFGSDKQTKAKELFKGFGPGFSMPYFEGCTHGFAVRGDMVRCDSSHLDRFGLIQLQNDPKVKAGKEGAFHNTVEWFKKHL